MKPEIARTEWPTLARLKEHFRATIGGEVRDFEALWKGDLLPLATQLHDKGVNDEEVERRLFEWYERRSELYERAPKRRLPQRPPRTEFLLVRSMLLAQLAVCQPAFRGFRRCFSAWMETGEPLADLEASLEREARHHSDTKAAGLLTYYPSGDENPRTLVLLDQGTVHRHLRKAVLDLTATFGYSVSQCMELLTSLHVPYLGDMTWSMEDWLRRESDRIWLEREIASTRRIVVSISLDLDERDLLAQYRDVRKAVGSARRPGLAAVAAVKHAYSLTDPVDENWVDVGDGGAVRPREPDWGALHEQWLEGPGKTHHLRSARSLHEFRGYCQETRERILNPRTLECGLGSEGGILDLSREAAAYAEAIWQQSKTEPERESRVVLTQ